MSKETLRGPFLFWTPWKKCFSEIIVMDDCNRKSYYTSVLACDWRLTPQLQGSEGKLVWLINDPPPVHSVLCRNTLVSSVIRGKCFATLYDKSITLKKAIHQICRTKGIVWTHFFYWSTTRISTVLSFSNLSCTFVKCTKWYQIATNTMPTEQVAAKHFRICVDYFLWKCMGNVEILFEKSAK